MSVKLTKEQLMEARKLLNNLKAFASKGYGSVSSVIILTNKATPDVLYIKYERNFITAGEMDYENKIASIDRQGKIDFVDGRFSDVFERAAFISECKKLNLDDENSYTII